MPAGTAILGIWKNGVMPSRLVLPTFGPWIFGVGTVFSGMHERVDAVLVHHALQRHPRDLAARQPIALARRRVIFKLRPVLGAGARLVVAELRVRDPRRPIRDPRVAAGDEVAVDVEHEVAALADGTARAPKVAKFVMFDRCSVSGAWRLLNFSR